MVPLTGKVLDAVLDRFPYCTDPSKAMKFLLDEVSESPSDTQVEQGSLLGGVVFFYGEESEFLDLESVSDTLVVAATDLRDYDERRIRVEPQTAIAELEKTKRPLLVEVDRRAPTDASVMRFETEVEGFIPLEHHLVVNESLLELALRLTDKFHVDRLAVILSPLGVVDFALRVPPDQLFRSVRFGVLTGYVFLFVYPGHPVDASARNAATFERARTVLRWLWLIANSDDRYHLFRYEREARENFMAEVVHRWRGVVEAPLYRLLQMQDAVRAGRRESLEQLVASLPHLPVQPALDFSANLEQYLGEHGMRDVDLDLFCREKCETFSQTYGESVSITGQTSRTVRVLESELSFCLGELLYNARKHKRENSDINVVLRDGLSSGARTRLPTWSQAGGVTNLSDSTVTIEVRNMGMGIPQKFKERIFEVRSRLRRDRSGIFLKQEQERQARGMGLYLVRKYVQEHYGGLVFEDGQPGKSARFSMVLFSSRSEGAL